MTEKISFNLNFIGDIFCAPIQNHYCKTDSSNPVKEGGFYKRFTFLNFLPPTDPFYRTFQNLLEYNYDNFMIIMIITTRLLSSLLYIYIFFFSIRFLTFKHPLGNRKINQYKTMVPTRDLEIGPNRIKLFPKLTNLKSNRIHNDLFKREPNQTTYIIYCLIFY